MRTLGKSLTAVGVAAALAVAVAGGVTPAPLTSAHATGSTMTIGTSEVEATFANPTAGPNPGDVVSDRSVIDQLERLIRGTPTGQTIHLAIYHLSLPDVYDTLYDAVVNRKVNVFLVHDASDGGTYAQKVAAIPGIHNTWCDHGNSSAYGTGCLSSNPTGIMHAKYAVFSQTTDPSGTLKPWVTWFGSANETASTGINAFNNTVTVYGDQTLYDDFLNGVWNRMAAEPFLTNNDFYKAGEGQGYFGSSASNVTVYASPEQDTDLVANRLSYIDPDTTCQVRFMENDIHHNAGVRQELFDQLHRLDVGGCHMYAVAANIDHDARCAIYHDHMTTHQDQTGNGPGAAGLPNQVSVHDKAIIVYAKYAGSTSNRYIVFTGSHNLTKSALRYNDELFVKIDDSQPLYQAFYDHFGAAYSKTTTYPVPSDC